MVAMTHRSLHQSGARVAETRARVRSVYESNGLPGGGPWRILENCAAPRHNSLRAAEGRNRTLPCLCPRAQELKAKRRLEERAVRRDAEDRKRLQSVKAPGATAMPAPVTKPWPDFQEGLCALPEWRSVADDGLDDTASLMGIARRERAKDLCAYCRIKPVCKSWVTEQESPPGSWGGVYGGMDPWNRAGLELIIKDKKAQVIPYVEH